MARVLVTSLPHAGHLNPTFAIARALQARGHEVMYLDHPLIRQAINAQGFARVRYRRPNVGDAILLWHKWRLGRAQGAAETRRAILLFSARLAHEARALAAIFTQARADLILNDVFDYGAKLAAELNGVPWVDCWSAGLCVKSSVPLTRSECRPPDAIADGITDDVLDLFDRRLAAARRALKLAPAPARALLAPSPWLQLYLTSEDVELPHSDPGASAVYIGPSFVGRREQALGVNFPQAWLEDDVPLVYVSLGTFFNKRPAFFRRVVAAFADAPLRIIASTPFADARAFARLPANIRFLPYVRQLALLPHVRAFITHGGANSVNEALASGVPMLAVPIGGEQMYNAARVCELGCGRYADVARVTAPQLREHVQALLNDRDYRAAAQRAQRVLARCDAPAVAAQLIEKIIRTGAPIQRPPGSARTLYGDTPLPAWAL